MSVPYGPGEEQLGTADQERSPGWGPEYGAPSADGTWWILDLHKRRVARFDAQGVFLGAVPVPGRYMDVQFPFVLDERWLVINGAPTPGVVADPQRARRVEIPEHERFVPWTHSDGHAVYGDDGTAVHVVTADGRGGLEFGRADSMRAGDGSRFLVRAEEDHSTLTVDLLDRPNPVRISLRMTGPDERRIEPATEYAADASGTIHLLVVADLDGTQLAGYLSITSDGQVNPIESVANPLTESAPGSPARLRVVPGTSEPAIVAAETDALVVRIRGAPSTRVLSGQRALPRLL
jgi:hypothetical protein